MFAYSGRLFLFTLTAALVACEGGFAQPPAADETDRLVRTFLQDERDNWQDLNVPYTDGQLLHDRIVQNKFKNALEIGTSTGHSAIWMAWALRKTGGRLTTIEIDAERYRIALENLERAGLRDRVNAIHGDAHTIVPGLAGPFDFVFSDADKEWYIKYFEFTHPKLEPGGIFAAHNILNTGLNGIPEFNAFIKSRRDYETTYDRSSGAGISFSRKK